MAPVHDVGIEAGPEAVPPIDRHAETYGPLLNHVKGFASRACRGSSCLALATA
jgi:hypothetical protein